MSSSSWWRLCLCLLFSLSLSLVAASSSPSPSASAPASSSAASLSRRALRSSSVSLSSATVAACLDGAAFIEAKEALQASFLAIADQYLQIWKAAGWDEGSIDQLYSERVELLKEEWRDAFHRLQRERCPSTSHKDTRQRHHLSRRLASATSIDDEEVEEGEDRSDDKGVLIMEEEEWLREVNAKSSQLLSPGILPSRADPPMALIMNEQELWTDDDKPYPGASIRPFTLPTRHSSAKASSHDAPSAFTELSQRDIESQHSLTPIDLSEDEDARFLASITPAREHKANQRTPATKPQREIDEEIEDERRRRREELKRGNGLVLGDKIATRPKVPLSSSSMLEEEEEQSITHLVASIRPMAPQQSSLVYAEEDSLDKHSAPSHHGRASITPTNVALVHDRRDSDSSKWLMSDETKLSDSAASILARLKKRLQQL